LLHADPQRALFKGKTLQYIEERMALSVWRAGALPIPISKLDDGNAAEIIMSHIDGLVLSGGADVSPRSYGEEPLQPQWDGDPVRDAYERELVEIAVRRGLPVLGLCRGIQLLNVALGGTLWQDIETQLEGSLVHRDWHRYDELGHAIEVAPDSWVSRLYGGARTLEVNSIHHQGLRRLAPPLRATAWAADGVVEAVEWIDSEHFIVGIQWHPEWLEAEQVTVGALSAGRAAGHSVFEAFVAACRTRTI
jgi:putative glutamine amidotransferase